MNGCSKSPKTLYLVERADIAPQMTLAELDKLFTSGTHIAHRHFGLVELPEEIDFSLYLNKPTQTKVSVTKTGARYNHPEPHSKFSGTTYVTGGSTKGYDREHLPQTRGDDRQAAFHWGANQIISVPAVIPDEYPRETCSNRFSPQINAEKDIKE